MGTVWVTIYGSVYESLFWHYSPVMPCCNSQELFMEISIYTGVNLLGYTLFSLYASVGAYEVQQGDESRNSMIRGMFHE
jgi:hypothetical protein